VEFYPAGVPVPAEKRTDRLLLRPLRAADAELDYEAVIASAEQLRRWSQSGWPAGDFTRAQNRDGLLQHEREHHAREAFTFTILNPPGTRCLGCVYIMPVWREAAPLCARAAYAAHVGFWVRTSELAVDLDMHLLDTLRAWLRAEWAFDCIVFTISQQEARQAALFARAGLEWRAAFALPDGRLCWSFS